MSICIVVPPGYGLPRSIPPREESPAFGYYKYTNPGKNDGLCFKWYFEKMKNITPTMERDGKLFELYAVEQDGIKERYKYNPNTNKCKFQGYF